MTPTTVTARVPRAPHPSKTAAAKADAPTGDDAADAATQAQQRALAVQKQDFDFATQEQAELEREREALQSLMMAMLKNEDEITKKWIEMI